MKRPIPTAFDAPGTFAAETLIDIVQRAVACLQDAGAERISDITLTLTVVDRHGAPCPLCLDGCGVGFGVTRYDLGKRRLCLLRGLYLRP